MSKSHSLVLTDFGSNVYSQNSVSAVLAENTDYIERTLSLYTVYGWSKQWVYSNYTGIAFTICRTNPLKMNNAGCQYIFWVLKKIMGLKHTISVCYFSSDHSCRLTKKGVTQSSQCKKRKIALDLAALPEISRCKSDGANQCYTQW